MKNQREIDISNIPFSRYGAYVSVNYDEGENYLTIHNVQRRFGEDKAFVLTFRVENEPVKFTAKATPYLFCVDSSQGTALIYIRNDRSLVIKSNGLDLYLKQISEKGYGIKDGNDCYKIISVDKRTYTTINILKGKGILNGPMKKGPGGKLCDHRERLKVICQKKETLLQLEIDQVESKLKPEHINIDKEINVVKQEWEEFLKKMPEVPRERRKYAEIAWYTQWSSFVRAYDNYKYDAMLMSKNHMSSIWSWDHCFNALAMARVDLQTAIEQFLLPFEVQAESGILPDMWNPNSEVVWGVTKPPIHGWCFEKLMDYHNIEEKTLEKVYKHLEKWTNYWFDYRDFDKDGIPAYPYANDSGWDGSKIFNKGFFIESPDLTAYLILQMKTLSRIAINIGEKEVAKEWRNKANDLLKRFIRHSWREERFVARMSGSHGYDKYPESSLALIPIILGSILEQEKIDKLVNILKRKYITENGIASNIEVNKGKIKPRGIWASINYLFVDGLKSCGYEELARKVAKGFCNMVETHGPYEGFYVDGNKRGVPGYTWTSSVYLLFVWEYLMN